MGISIRLTDPQFNSPKEPVEQGRECGPDGCIGGMECFGKNELSRYQLVEYSAYCDFHAALGAMTPPPPGIDDRVSTCTGLSR